MLHGRVHFCAEITAFASEERLGVDFSDIWAHSGLARCACQEIPCMLTLHFYQIRTGKMPHTVHTSEREGPMYNITPQGYAECYVQDRVNCSRAVECVKCVWHESCSLPLGSVVLDTQCLHSVASAGRGRS